MSSEATYFPQKINGACSDPSILLNHTCLRIKDPKVSIPFYERHFGMKLLDEKQFPDMKFGLYFLAFPANASGDSSKTSVFARSGVLELTHNYGTENDPEFKTNNGNLEPHLGFTKISFSVQDVPKEAARLQEEGVTIKKKVFDGRDATVALDPDGYWIELTQYNTDGYVSKDSNIKFNHTMLRVKNMKKSLQFYQNVLGMSILSTSEHPETKNITSFLGYNQSASIWDREGVLALLQYPGTEEKPDFSYHSGNTEPKGYGHICITVKDPEPLCKEIEDTYPDIAWAPRYNQGKMKRIAFVKDPDGYSIEIIPASF